MTRRIDSPDTETDLALRAHLLQERPAPFVVRAGAGSGKTTSLIKALASLMASRGPHLEANQQRIACITYTEVAVKEIRADVRESPLVHVSTIHSFLWELCRPFQSDINAWVRAAIEGDLESLRGEREGYALKPRTHDKTKARNAAAIAVKEQQLRGFSGRTSFTYGVATNYDEGVLGHDAVIKLATHLLENKPLLARLTAQRYPYFFVDESQDTMPTVVNALRVVASGSPSSNAFCLGFFGDPMQQIYATGVGEVVLESGWEVFDKPNNFRSSESVLRLVNKIRGQGDGLVQEGERKISGSARLFVLPADGDRESDLHRVRVWLATQNHDPLWSAGGVDSDVRVLVIAHRMAAVRLGFLSLHDAFSKDSWEADKAGFHEGDHWLLQPALRLALPLLRARRAGDEAEVLSLLRAQSDRLQPRNLDQDGDVPALLAELSGGVKELVSLFDDESGATIRDLYECISRNGLGSVNERVAGALAGSDASVGIKQNDELAEKPRVTVEQCLACSVKELIGYEQYIEKLSPYATQQGVKGAEFERVVVVLDDEQGRHFQFSYDKLLGIKPLSDVDKKHRDAGEDSVLERTLRLFYVCCSRARLDLAVVLYASDPAGAATLARAAGYFEDDAVIEGTGLLTVV